MFYEARRYNIHGKELLSTMNKYYAADIGIRNMLGELAPLRKISDNHPKYLLTLDEVFGEMNYDGIQKINVLKWKLPICPVLP